MGGTRRLTCERAGAAGAVRDERRGQGLSRLFPTSPVLSAPRGGEGRTHRRSCHVPLRPWGRRGRVRWGTEESSTAIKIACTTHPGSPPPRVFQNRTTRYPCRSSPPCEPHLHPIGQRADHHRFQSPTFAPTREIDNEASNRMLAAKFPIPETGDRNSAQSRRSVSVAFWRSSARGKLGVGAA